ncbi:HAD family hydrolase [Maridesulfovibrio sp. FT414]|uniref:HAD family hydrolase n=1 Tax=Maridesulfovibrio sp. FT414 TaxID=2979469 RepID=UPI003D8038ED
MTPEIQAVFFDMGETLYTYKDLPLSWKDHFQAAWQEALTACGYFPDELELSTLSGYMGRFNTREVAREVEYDSNHILGGALESIGCDSVPLSGVTSNFFNYFRNSLSPYPETAAALEMLRTRNIKVGALTDVAYGMPRAFIADDLKQVGILHLIDVWKTSVDIGFRKPSPKGLAHLCALSGCRPESAIYVGNERKDVQAANNAGLISVLIHRSGLPEPDWGQEHTIHSLMDCPGC